MKTAMSLNNKQDSLLWVLAIALTIGYGLSSFLTIWPIPIKVGLGIIWLIGVVWSLIFTTGGKKLSVFVKDSKNEILKVVWPTRQETTQTTLIVMLVVFVSGFVLWAIDSGMMWLIGKITYLG